MKIKYLYIKDYKSLKDFKITINKPITLFIGENGSGKSTLFEAIAWIFRCAHLNFVEKKNETPPFEFEIIYELRLEKIISESSTVSEFATDYLDVNLKGQRDNNQFWSLSTGNYTYSTKELIERHGIEGLLPVNILVYYSGWFETMQLLCKEHEDLYKERLLRVKSETDINTSADDLYSRVGILPMLYIQKHHFDILLASLYSFEYNERINQFFLDDLGIQIPEDIPLSLIIKRRQWKSGEGPEKFWGAEGLLRGFLDVIKRFSYNETYGYADSDDILYNFHLKDWYGLREFYGEEKKLFYMLHMLHASDMLGDIQLFMNKNTIAISHNDLSEGEQQLITIKAINELLIERNTLLLLDEPDTYLHPQWQATFLKGVFDYIELGDDQPQFLIASHSTIMLSNLKEGNLFKMKDGKATFMEAGYYGREYGFNLSAIMGGNERVPEVQEQFDHLFELIDSANYDSALSLLDELKRKYQDDPELTRAETMLIFFKGE